MAAALGAASGAVFALVAQQAPANKVGAVTGLVGAAGGLGGFVPPLVMGSIYGGLGSYAVGLVALAVVAALVLEVPVLELIKPQPDDLVTLPSQLISAEDLRAVVLGTYRDEDAPLALLVAADEAMDAVNRARVALNVAAISMRRGRYPVTDEAEADDGKN